MEKKASNLTTALVTLAGTIPAAALVEWAKTKGLTLTPEAAQLAAGSCALAIGAAADWVVAVVDSFVGAVVAINNAIANRATQITDKVGGRNAKTPQ